MILNNPSSFDTPFVLNIDIGYEVILYIIIT